MNVPGSCSARGCRIVYVIGSLDLGGAERHLTDIAPALRMRGYCVTVYCLSGRGAMGDSLAASGVRVIGPPLKAGALSFLGRPGWYLAFILSMLKLWALLLVHRPAILHCFLPMANIVGIVCARLSFTRRIVASRRSLNRYQSRHPFYGRLERRLNQYAHAIVSNSYAAERELVRDEGVRPERITVIHNGIPLSRTESPDDRLQSRKSLGIPENALVFVIVANLIDYKGHLDLVAALAGIAASLPEEWLLLVAGRDDGAGPSVLKVSRSHGMDRHVRMLGPRTDIPQLLRAADIGVLCSHEEGFPNAVIEYMAAGLPVVATDVGGTGEAVSDDETGYLVPPQDSRALGAALLRLADDGSARQRMGEAGRRRAHAQFSFDACVSAYDRLYRGLLDGPP